jgi:hypothetical protein
LVFPLCFCQSIYLMVKVTVLAFQLARFRFLHLSVHGLKILYSSNMASLLIWSALHVNLSASLSNYDMPLQRHLRELYIPRVWFIWIVI